MTVIVSLRWAFALIGFAFAGTAQAQNLPPLPGPTLEYRSAREMFQPEQSGKRLELMLAACQKTMPRAAMTSANAAQRSC